MPKHNRLPSQDGSFAQDEQLLVPQVIDDETIKKKQGYANKVAAAFMSFRPFNLLAIFYFMRNLQKVFQTTTLYYVTLPIAVVLESVEVINNLYKIIIANKATPRQWLSLGVNLLKLAGVSLAAGILLSGVAVAGGVLAIMAGSALAAAIGIKALWLAGSSIYKLAASFAPRLTQEQKSDLRHEALDHAMNAVVTAAMAVTVGFIMLKGLLLVAAVGTLVTSAGAAVNLGILVKRHIRNKNKENAASQLAHETESLSPDNSNDNLVGNNLHSDLRSKPQTGAWNSFKSTMSSGWDYVSSIFSFPDTIAATPQPAAVPPMQTLYANPALQRDPASSGSGSANNSSTVNQSAALLNNGDTLSPGYPSLIIPKEVVDAGLRPTYDSPRPK